VSLAATYDSALSRVRLSVTGLSAAATVAVFERSPDQITWTTVRGGTAVTVSANAASLDDYEFNPDVVNYYRVTTPSVPAFVSAGTAAHANNASVSPGLPASIAAGDLLLIWAAIRNSGTGTVNTPTGYTLLLDMSNARLFGKIASASESGPTVAFTDGVANADTSAQMAAFRNVPLTATASGALLNASAQNIVTPALAYESVDSALIVWPAWKQDDWTSVDIVSSGIEIGEPDTTTGDDQGVVWDYRIPPPPVSTVAARTFVVTGGASAISRGGAIVWRANREYQITSITPTLSQVWLKSIGRPFLNTPVIPLRPLPVVETEPRHGVFDIVGRSNPVAVTDVRSSKGYVLRLFAETDAERDRIEMFIASGDPVFLHCPAGSPRPGSVYGVFGATSYDPLVDVYTMPLRVVAAPGPDVVGATATWQTVVDTYATWADVIAAHATWADLLELVADPNDVIVP
jgi:hypothetical protein